MKQSAPNNNTTRLMRLEVPVYWGFDPNRTTCFVYRIDKYFDPENSFDRRLLFSSALGELIENLEKVGVDNPSAFFFHFGECKFCEDGTSYHVLKF